MYIRLVNGGGIDGGSGNGGGNCNGGSGSKGQIGSSRCGQRLQLLEYRTSPHPLQALCSSSDSLALKTFFLKIKKDNQIINSKTRRFKMI